MLHFLDRGKPLTKWELSVGLRTLGGERYWCHRRGTSVRSCGTCRRKGRYGGVEGPRGNWPQLDDSVRAPGDQEHNLDESALLGECLKAIRDAGRPFIMDWCGDDG